MNVFLGLGLPWTAAAVSLGHLKPTSKFAPENRPKGPKRSKDRIFQTIHHVSGGEMLDLGSAIIDRVTKTIFFVFFALRKRSLSGFCIYVHLDR